MEFDSDNTTHYITNTNIQHIQKKVYKHKKMKNRLFKNLNFQEIQFKTEWFLAK